MKIFRKLAPTWWSIEIDYLDNEFIREIKEFEEVNYDEKKKNLMINMEKISEREKKELVFLVDLFGYTNLVNRLNELDRHLSFKKGERSSYLQRQCYELKGKGVFCGLFSPRFWLEWEALYRIVDVEKAWSSRVLDATMYYQFLINSKINSKISQHVLEVGEKNSVSWFYDNKAILDKEQKILPKPLPLIDFDDILRRVRDERLNQNHIIDDAGIKIEVLMTVAYGPVEKPYLGLWKIKQDFYRKKTAEEIYNPIFSNINKIRASLVENNAQKDISVQSQVPHKVAQDSKSKILSKEVNAFVLYLPTSTGIGTEISAISEKKIRKEYLQKRNDYSILVYTRRVFVKIRKELKPLPMDERIYRLLVIFLRQKDMVIPPIPLYRKAWADSPSKIVSITDERDVSPYLKTAISELRSILKNVPDFEITKARFQGYICSGKFQFCAIIPKAEEKKYVLSEAEEQEADLST